MRSQFREAIVAASRRNQSNSLPLATLLFSFAVRTSAQGELSRRTEFVDVTESAGIKFVHFKGNEGIPINLEEFGPGVCVSDFNRDGWQIFTSLMDATL